MQAMVLERQREPLGLAQLPDPRPAAGQVLVSVRVCGVCRTDLHIVDGDLKRPKLPLVPGHQIVGRVTAAGEGVERFEVGQRVGVPWLGWTCGECRYCLSGRENLCDLARFTGYDVDGGYAELAVADERFCFSIPMDYRDEQAAPLLCAGLIGYRALRLVGDAERIVFAPVGALMPAALRASAKGARIVSAGIHMSDIPAGRLRGAAVLDIAGTPPTGLKREI